MSLEHDRTVISDRTCDGVFWLGSTFYTYGHHPQTFQYRNMNRSLGADTPSRTACTRQPAVSTPATTHTDPVGRTTIGQETRTSAWDLNSVASLSPQISPTPEEDSQNCSNLKKSQSPTQKLPFGFAILGRHMPVTDDACWPKFSQFSKSVEEYIIGVSLLAALWPTQ